jgi:gliding motility-associated lipoprotein GldH
MRRIAILKFIVLFAIAVLLNSCGEQPYYEKVYSFENKEWNQQVKPSFTVEIKDVNKEYNFIVTLRTSTDYKYSNLWIFMSTITPDGQKAREPFQIPITYPDGSWVGAKTGTIVEHPLRFNRRKMPKAGKYTFTLEQGITESVIDEVLDIGFRVEEVNNGEE